MANFIEEFYYGNLDPQARSTKQNKTVQKQMEVLLKIICSRQKKFKVVHKEV
ncbi:MAG: hypothetical protein IJP22_04100 [Clostridia bacterium]|nr:hypothetical protein [Clostridia bacterium]